MRNGSIASQLHFKEDPMQQIIGEDEFVMNVLSSDPNPPGATQPLYPGHNVYANFSLNYVLPFSNHDNSSLMAIAAFYALLFLLGTCGNAAILAVVHHVKGSDSRSRHNTTLTYICILCVVDFLSMLPLPMTIIDQVLGFWMFGTFACKLFRLLEHIGKIFSTFILVAFSVDRYCAVCHPLQIRVRNQRLVYSVLLGMFLTTCAMLSPILLYAHSKELIVHEKVDMGSRSITRLHLYKCVDDLGDTLFVLFTLYCFVLAYLVPLLLMIFFYYRMLTRLFKQSRAVRQTLAGRRKGIDDKQIPVGHIAAYTFAICSFHFLCWTPYWMSCLYSVYQETFNQGEMWLPSTTFIYIMYGVHALPYINSASNFILYGLLNRQLHQSSQSRRHHSMTRTNGRASHVPAMRLTECSDALLGAASHSPPHSPRTPVRKASPCVTPPPHHPIPNTLLHSPKNGYSTESGRDTALTKTTSDGSLEEQSIII